MRDKMTIRSTGNEWKLTIPGFGFNSATEKHFTRWSDAMEYVHHMPMGSSGAYERGSHTSDGIGARPPWSPLQQW